MGTVKYLLDTHSLLWAVRDSEKLGANATLILEDINAQIFVSAVSAYEIMYKYKLGKLPEYAYIAENYFDILRILNVDELVINTQHSYYAGKFEWAHRDPFDRMLAAQAIVDKLSLITNDSIFGSIPAVSVVW